MSPAKVDSVTTPEVWTTAATLYQGRLGQTTVHAGALIVHHINTYAPFNEESYCLDVGTGGGSLAIKIREKSPPGTRILATDISPGMLEQVDSLRMPNVITQQADAITLAGLEDSTFSHVVTSFVIQFTPDPPETIRQMYRVLKPGGMAGIVVWGDYTGPLDIHDRACRLVKPNYQLVSPYTTTAWTSKAEHYKQMEAAGFKEIGIDNNIMPFHCKSGQDFTDWWYRFKNPIAAKMLEAAREQGVDMERLPTVMTKLVDDEYEQGHGIYFTGVLGWGVK